MSEQRTNTHADGTDWYEIRLEGHLEDRWANWFEGLSITRDADGSTRLTGLVLDQAALHGLLKKVRDLGLALLTVRRMDTSGRANGQKDDRPPEDDLGETYEE